MKILKIISVILLAIFVITLPLAAFARNLSGQVMKEENLKDLVNETVLSNEALPQRIREAIWFQSFYSEDGLDTQIRVMLTGIRNEQYAALLETVLPIDTRELLLDDVVGEVFGWLDGEETYPNIVIEVSPLFNHIQNSTPAVATWVVETLKVPPCKSEQLTSLTAGENADNLMNLIACKPAGEYKEIAIGQLTPLLDETLSETVVPERISITEQLQASMDEAKVLATKSQVNQVRSLSSLIWLLPLIIFGIALALVVRSWDDLIVWAGWPLFICGLIGIILATQIANPISLLESQLMPPPAAMPAPAAPIVMAILGSLLAKVGGALMWQMGIMLFIGLALLVYNYQELIITSLSRFWAWLKHWFVVNEMNVVESK